MGCFPCLPFVWQSMSQRQGERLTCSMNLSDSFRENIPSPVSLMARRNSHAVHKVATNNTLQVPQPGSTSSSNRHANRSHHEVCDSAPSTSCRPKLGVTGLACSLAPLRDRDEYTILSLSNRTKRGIWYASKGIKAEIWATCP